MEYKELNEIVKSVLYRGCSCTTTNVNPCPAQNQGGWHTWRRVKRDKQLAVRLATCFVGDGSTHEYTGVLTVNMATAKEAALWISKGINLGLDCDIDKGDANPKRVWVDTKALNKLNTQQEEFIKALLKDAVGAF